MENNMTKQTKSKERVAGFGEVFTSEREVNNMLDLVKNETERIESRFLEPACGDGNFLIEILRRKLNVVKSRYSKNPTDYERYSILALSSIYGVELLQDNTEACRSRLFNYWNEEYSKVANKSSNDETRAAAKFILQRNILNGDALTFKEPSGEPIIFSEWTAVNSVLFKRRDFRLDELLVGHEEQLSIFSTDWEYDEEIKALIPKPIKEFPPIHYKKVIEHE
jgi:hypothetical protein